jgi:hypothetical protein
MVVTIIFTEHSFNDYILYSYYKKQKNNTHLDAIRICVMHAHIACITHILHAKSVQFDALAILFNNNFGSNVLMANLHVTL